MEERVDACDHGPRGAASLQVQEINFAAGPSALDGDQHGTAIGGDAGADELIRRSAFAEQDTFAGVVEAPVDEPAPFGARAADEVEAIALRSEGDGAVQSRGQCQRKRAARVHIDEADDDLVAPALSDRVRGKLAVASNSEILNGRGRLRRDRRGIDEHDVGAIGGLAHAQHGTLPRAAFLEEIATARDDGSGDRVAHGQFGEPRAQLGAAGQSVEDRGGVRVLRRQPFAGLRALQIVQPGIGIGELHAMQRFAMRIHARGRRLGSESDRGGQ